MSSARELVRHKHVSLVVFTCKVKRLPRRGVVEEFDKMGEPQYYGKSSCSALAWPIPDSGNRAHLILPHKAVFKGAMHSGLFVPD